MVKLLVNETTLRCCRGENKQPPLRLCTTVVGSRKQMEVKRELIVL